MFLYSCNKDETFKKETKSLKDNIFAKNAAGSLFSFDINTKIVNGKKISFISKNEVISIGHSSFSQKISPFHYDFDDLENFSQYINEGKIWFLPNNYNIDAFKVPKNALTLNKRTNKSGYIDCECEIFGNGDNFCEYDNSDGMHLCWTEACTQCDFIWCPDDPVASACLRSTLGGGVFVLADSIVLNVSNIKYVIGQSSILKFDFSDNAVVCYREQIENTIFSNGLINLNISNLNNINNLDSLWFVPFSNTVQLRNGSSAEPSCDNTSCNGSCELKLDNDGCYRCKCSEDDSTTSCKLNPEHLIDGGVLLFANFLTVIDI